MGQDAFGEKRCEIDGRTGTHSSELSEFLSEDAGVSATEANQLAKATPKPLWGQRVEEAVWEAMRKSMQGESTNQETTQATRDTLRRYQDELDAADALVSPQSKREGRAQVVKRVVVMGPPGSGRGRLCDMLCAHHDLAHLNIADMLTRTYQDGDVEGQALEAKCGYFLKREKRPPSAVLAALLVYHIKRCRHHGWVLDGFPTNVAEEATLMEALGAEYAPDAVFQIRISGEQVVGNHKEIRVDPLTGNVYGPRRIPLPEDPAILGRLVHLHKHNGGRLLSQVRRYEDAVVGGLGEVFKDKLWMLDGRADIVEQRTRIEDVLQGKVTRENDTFALDETIVVDNVKAEAACVAAAAVRGVMYPTVEKKVKKWETKAEKLAQLAAWKDINRELDMTGLTISRSNVVDFGEVGKPPSFDELKGEMEGSVVQRAEQRLETGKKLDEKKAEIKLKREEKQAVEEKRNELKCAASTENTVELIAIASAEAQSGEKMESLKGEMQKSVSARLAAEGGADQLRASIRANVQGEAASAGEADAEALKTDLNKADVSAETASLSKAMVPELQSQVQANARSGMMGKWKKKGESQAAAVAAKEVEPSVTGLRAEMLKSAQDRSATEDLARKHQAELDALRLDFDTRDSERADKLSEAVKASQTHKRMFEIESERRQAMEEQVKELQAGSSKRESDSIQLATDKEAAITQLENRLAQEASRVAKLEQQIASLKQSKQEMEAIAAEEKPPTQSAEARMLYQDLERSNAEQAELQKRLELSQAQVANMDKMLNKQGALAEQRVKGHEDQLKATQADSHGEQQITMLAMSQATQDAARFKALLEETQGKLAQAEIEKGTLRQDAARFKEAMQGQAKDGADKARAEAAVEASRRVTEMTTLKQELAEAKAQLLKQRKTQADATQGEAAGEGSKEKAILAACLGHLLQLTGAGAESELGRDPGSINYTSVAAKLQQVAARIEKTTNTQSGERATLQEALNNSTQQRSMSPMPPKEAPPPIDKPRTPRQPSYNAEPAPVEAKLVNKLRSEIETLRGEHSDMDSLMSQAAKALNKEVQRSSGLKGQLEKSQNDLELAMQDKDESDQMMEEAAQVINKERLKVRQLEKKLAAAAAPAGARASHGQ